jgi:hypothetical protein
MSPKFQKRSELEFVGRIIPRAKLSGTIVIKPKLQYLKAYFWVHTRGFIIGSIFSLSNLDCMYF